jgi:hypothetical protein
MSKLAIVSGLIFLCGSECLAQNFQVLESSGTLNSLLDSCNGSDSDDVVISGNMNGDPCLVQTQLFGAHSAYWEESSGNSAGAMIPNITVRFKVKWTGAQRPGVGGYSWTGEWRSKSKAYAQVERIPPSTLMDFVSHMDMDNVGPASRFLGYQCSAECEVLGGYLGRQASISIDDPEHGDSDSDGLMDELAFPFNDASVSWSQVSPMSGSITFSQESGDYIGYITILELSQKINISLAGESIEIGGVSASAAGALRKQFRILTIGSETVSTW